MKAGPFPWLWGALSVGVHLGVFAALPGPTLPERTDPVPVEVGLLLLTPAPIHDRESPPPPPTNTVRPAPPPAPAQPTRARRPAQPAPVPEAPPSAAVNHLSEAPTAPPPAAESIPTREAPEAGGEAPSLPEPGGVREARAGPLGVGRDEAGGTVRDVPSRGGPGRVEASASYAENPAPVYPRLARRRGLEGEVWLRVRVSARGEVLEVDVERSSTHPVLDRAAVEAVQQWRFHPARVGEVPVEGVVRVPVRFELVPSG